MTELTVPLVAVKLLVPTVPTSASVKVTVKVMAELVVVADALSVTVVTVGAVVSMTGSGVVSILGMRPLLAV